MRCSTRKRLETFIRAIWRDYDGNLERANVSRSVAMTLTGPNTEAVYLCYAISSTGDLAEGVAKLATLHGSEKTLTVLPFAAAGKH